MHVAEEFFHLCQMSAESHEIKCSCWHRRKLLKQTEPMFRRLKNRGNPGLFRLKSDLYTIHFLSARFWRKLFLIRKQVFNAKTEAVDGLAKAAVRATLEGVNKLTVYYKWYRVTYNPSQELSNAGQRYPILVMFSNESSNTAI
uniref:Uncharacterized protein n=1 Tax=Rhizophagus irregularis (strain DAOM 181602 / DAOM 197198 / MUCL 43194) TaxID=747089 RepID=U9TMQ1_RHIID